MYSQVCWYICIYSWVREFFGVDLFIQMCISYIEFFILNKDVVHTASAQVYFLDMEK